VTRTLLLCLGAVIASAQLPDGAWRTDLSRRSIDLRELKPGGPPKDGIPALNEPRLTTARKARSWLSPREPVIVVESGGAARAYPLQVLIWHELVNDRFGARAILVSYCPLCNSAVVFDRSLNGQEYEFGVSGMLRESDMVMFDRQTESLWQQITGEAIVGSLAGRKLTIVPSQTVSFETFQTQFPDGEVLSRNTGFDRAYGQNPYAGYESRGRPIVTANISSTKIPMQLRRSPLERILAVSIDGQIKAYPFTVLRRAGVLEDHIGSASIVIFFDDLVTGVLDAARISESAKVGAAAVFSPEMEGRRLRFERSKHRIVDDETHSEWNLFGLGTAGPLKGRQLAPVSHGEAFAFAWFIFRPDTELFRERSEGR
jgi:hypothetical protein